MARCNFRPGSGRLRHEWHCTPDYITIWHVCGGFSARAMRKVGPAQISPRAASSAVPEFFDGELPRGEALFFNCNF